MRFKILLAVTGLAVAAIAGETLADRDLTYVAYGGATQAGMREAWLKPYTAATGNAVAEDEGPSLAKVRAMVETGNVTWDVLDQETSEATTGCDEGLYEKLDYDRIGLNEDDFFPGMLQECGFGVYIAGNVLAYDGDRFPEGPTSWADFWDVEKFPGKRGFWNTPKGTLESALMADGVAPADVYKVLRSDGGIDRAFAKLDELKPNLVFWDTGAEMINRLASGEYAMTFAWNGRIVVANEQDKRNFKIAYPAGFTYVADALVIVKGSPNIDKAYELMKTLAAPEPNAEFMRQVPYSSTHKGAADLLTPERRAVLPLSPENLPYGVAIDDEFWAENYDSLTERLNAWAAK